MARRWFLSLLMALYKVGSYWVLVMMAWILADVGGRVMLGRPFSGTAEMVAYSLPIITFLQIPYVLAVKWHLRASILGKQLGPRGNQLIGVLTGVIGVALFGLAALSCWKPMVTAWAAGQYLGEGDIQIPAGPAWTVIIASCVLMVIQFLDTLVGDVRALFGFPHLSLKDE
jgi:TRAP-type C4-dicarboxylate transport system permease small subunit